MFKFRASALAAAALLIAIHVAVLLFHYGTQTASLWGDWLAGIANLVAAISSGIAARHAGPFGKRVWRLMSFSLFLAFIGQASYTYHFDYLHDSLIPFWPSDVLVFFWAVPAMMALFLSVRDPDSGFRWLRACDFAQVCTLAMSLELAVIYVPSQWQTASSTMLSRALDAGLIFFGLLAVSFLVRGLVTPFRTTQKLFRRLAIFFFGFAITTKITLNAQISATYQQGLWPDLRWTMVYGLLTFFAATWNDPEEQLAASVSPPSRGVQLLGLFAPLLIPAIVFPLVLRIAQEQFVWAVVLTMVSFAAAAGRMFVVQNQLLVSSHELQKNLSLLQGITEGTTDAIFVKDLQGRYLMMNTAGAGFLGRTVQDILGRTDAELFVPAVGRTIMERDRKVVESGETRTYEEFGTAAGVTRLYLATKGPFRDPSGQVLGLLGICRDITDRKRAEEEIRQSQQKLRMHIDHTPLAVVGWDLGLRVAAWNPSAERIFGYTREQALGKQASFFVPPQLRAQVDEIGRELLAGKGIERSTNENLTKDGRTISCEWYNTPLVDDSGRVLGVASLVQDVTERVALEDRLRQSQKMEAVGRLAGGVAHDFNNLLTVILGYTQILLDGLPAGSRLAEGTAQIKSAADRAAGITRQLLAFSRKQVRSPRLIDLNNVMLNLDTMLRRLIGEDIEVLTVPAVDLGTARADPGQIEQVLMNLALNARDAMPNGGKLTLETSNIQLDDAYAREHQPVEPGRYVMLAVSDTGIGMSPETLAHIFEPFYTTKEPGKGTGLGLSTVYGVVKASGGYIWVYSELGQGTTFKIYLPRVDQTAQPLTAESRPSGVQRGTETILLVEDDPQLNQLASSVLTHCGYKVLAAANPEEGLAVCRTHPNELHLLVTDVGMSE